MPLVQWDCPTEGCHGAILCTAEPHHGQIAFCRSWGMLELHCGRAMAWDSATGRWVSAEGLALAAPVVSG